MTEFSALALTDPLQRGLKEVGYGQMTPVQASSLPAILAGRDVVAQARTGSGKTAAFALGLLSALDATSSKLRGLVLVPIARDWHEKALQGLRASKIKGTTMRVRRIGS